MGYLRPSAALHCWANLGAYRWDSQRQFLGEGLELLGDLEALPDHGLLFLILALWGILHVVATIL